MMTHQGATAVSPTRLAPHPASHPLRLMHAAETITGGIASYLRDLLPMQRAALGRQMISVVIPASQRNQLPVPEGVAVMPFEDGGTRLGNAMRMARVVRQIVAQSAPDVVHLHSTYAGAAARLHLLTARQRPNVVYCPHGWAFTRHASPWSQAGAKWVERRLARLCDTIVCISEHEWSAALGCGIPAQKLDVVRNGVARMAPHALGESQVQWPAGKLRILYVGRFDRQKGVDVLLGALGKLKAEAFAYLVGGSVLNDMQITVNADNARSVGWLPSARIEPYYRSADVVVIPSRWEAFGLTSLEAMRAGLPVVASRVGGLVETVEDGVTGVLIPPGDAGRLVDTLRGLSREQLQQMGRAGRERFLTQFTMDEVHQRLLSVYGRAHNAFA